MGWMGRMVITASNKFKSNKYKTIDMKVIHKIIAGSLLTLLIVACAENPMDKELYKKEIYLVGANDRVWEIDVNYSDQIVENFFTVSSSGTLNLDKDVNVSIGIDENMVAVYNKKFLGELNEDKFYEPLDQTLYKIPSMDHITIKYKENISADIPVFIETKDLDADHRYVIPVQITSSSPYEVNESGRKMLIHLNLKNEYSGSYQLDGYMTELNTNPRRIQKVKVITATGINTIRLFYAMNNESSKMTDIATKTIEITISDEFVEGSTTVKKVSVTGWNSLQITDAGIGTFNTVNKELNIKYTTVENGTIYEEKLTLTK